jgi:hypothetical protein
MRFELTTSSLEDSRSDPLSYTHKIFLSYKSNPLICWRSLRAPANHRPCVFKRADGESRTHDLLFTRQLLQPIELHRRTAEARIELAISRFKAERVANYATPHQSGWRRT